MQPVKFRKGYISHHALLCMCYLPMPVSKLIHVDKRGTPGSQWQKDFASEFGEVGYKYISVRSQPIVEWRRVLIRIEYVVHMLHPRRIVSTINKQHPLVTFNMTNRAKIKVYVPWIYTIYNSTVHHNTNPPTYSLTLSTTECHVTHFGLVT